MLFPGQRRAHLGGMRFLRLCLGWLTGRHRLETLRGLDDHLLRDIGFGRSVTNAPADYGTPATGV
jgi:hypothetical protein